MTMDADDLRRHLVDGAAPTEGRGGSAADVAPMMTALSVVSTDVGRLDERVKELAGTLETLEAGQERVDSLREDLAALAEKVAALGKTVELLADDQDAPEPPPQPWDWPSMSGKESIDAIRTLAEWMESDLFRWWPQTAEKVPTCWMKHMDMLRDLSLLYVSYQQAYKHPGRRIHHEVDWRRSLNDMLDSIDTARKTYNCDSDKEHTLRHVTRSDRDHVDAHLRQMLLGQIYQADRAGDQDRVAHLMDEHQITMEELRTRMKRVFTSSMAVVDRKDASPRARRDAAREAARVLLAYRVVEPNDLSQAPKIESLMKALYAHKDPSFERVARTYDDLARLYATIRDDVLPQMVTGGGTPLEQQVMREHGVTPEQVALVRRLTNPR